ncbi:MAG: hypothetical protein JO128_13695 [Alphaproteobacteria bacterium]|nr:hypothetical protein [Alphaproteobacteria bacterium]
MTALHHSQAFLAFAVGAALALPPVASQAAGHGEHAAVYPDSARCRLLSQQVDRAMAEPRMSLRPLQLALRGEELCRSGDFAEGADLLDEAVRLIGETPALPPPIRRL